VVEEEEGIGNLGGRSTEGASVVETGGADGKEKGGSGVVETGTSSRDVSILTCILGNAMMAVFSFPASYFLECFFLWRLEAT
jgi:hypothetical protein